MVAGMTIMPTSLLTVGLCAVLAGCDGPPQPAASPTMAAQAIPQAGTAPATPPAFTVCSACHAARAGQHGIGPSLAGVFGRPAAAAPGFGYSPALKGSRLVWDEATLDRFLANPRMEVPGTSMAFAGLRNAERRRQIIAWLKTI